MADRITLDGRSGAVALDPACGHLAALALGAAGARVEPLFRAPWADDADALDPSIPPVVRRLSGDFFCAPFSHSDVLGGPPHGPGANAPWREVSRTEPAPGDRRVMLECLETLAGARLVKTLRLRDGDPVLYQSHRLIGGTGSVPVAHHAMIRPAGGCRLSGSARRWAATPPAPLEPDPARGRSILAYPQTAPGLDRLELADGRRVDARTYPFAEGHEDLLMLVEADLGGLGWTAAACVADGFLVFTVKPSAVLPATVLWLSNGGRRYAPFDRSSGGVLGIEDACSLFHLGHAASAAPNPVSAAGVPTALRLDPGGGRTVRHALGAVPIDARWTGDVTLTVDGDRLRIEDAGGAGTTVPFDAAWLTAGEAEDHG